ncbi:hypothetical protein LPW11_18325 [Geomonas sp. RF6]|uniref:hypothetical protein n=1 Tax=Geomonas sp. RF6 TaxID=2897342 RepID=UPI001E425121|nr:hypothetical protein [Geomonas sp. RF6]UFS69833.1 hypothetical protein LPW11_18325 [Geomonas sp. RF6]
MSTAKTFTISAAAAPYVGAAASRDAKLQAAAGAVQLPETDLVLLVYYLCHDPDPEVKARAMGTLKGLDLPVLTRLLSNPELHPRLVDALARLHYGKPELAGLFREHPHLGEQTATFLVQQGVFSLALPELPDGEGASPIEEEDDGEVDEESEEFRSKYQLSQDMKVSEKIKMALTGDKEWRSILIKDSNKLVSAAVVKNPRLTESEVLAVAKSAVQNDEIMRVICANKEWVKNYQIRRALAWNHKTPLQTALRFVATLSEKDLAAVAKSKNVSTVVATQARRILLAKKDR